MANPLRPITQRLTTTPVRELPQIAYFLASSIAGCSHILETDSSQVSTKGNDNVVLVHKLKTRVSSLLQERSHHGRFTAVVLIKAIVEAGGREVLSSSEPWVRGLLAILGRHDSISTKKLCLITLTRIFLLTQQYPTLVREITTPLLPAFITSCLNLIKPTVIHAEGGPSTILSPLLETALKCFLNLLPHHPTTFRPFVTRLKPIALSLVGEESTPLFIANAASKMLASLHFSAAKNTAASEWAQVFKCIISSSHRTTDQLFRAFIEDWEPPEQAEYQSVVNKNYENQVQGSEQDPLGLCNWVGVHNGVQRIVRLLTLLKSFLSQQTAQAVSCHLGSIVDLTARLTSVAALMDAKASQFSTRQNGEVGRDEKDELWMELPFVHIAVIDLLSVVTISFSGACIPVVRSILVQVVNCFAAEKRNSRLRIVTYRLIQRLLSVLGSSMTKSDVKDLTVVIKSCCADLTPNTRTEVSPSSTKPNGTGRSRPNGFTPTDADAFVSDRKETHQELSAQNVNETYCAAFRLLPSFLSALPVDVVPHSLRTEIDRTAILAQSERAMFASVLNPPAASKGRHAPPSVIPFFARMAGGGLDLEGLLRPRMLIVRNDKLLTIDHDASSDVDSDIETPSLNHARGADLLDRLEYSLDNAPSEIRDHIGGPNIEAMSGRNPTGKGAPEANKSMKRSFAFFDENRKAGDSNANLSEIAEPAFSGVPDAESSKRPRLYNAEILHTGEDTVMVTADALDVQDLSRPIAKDLPKVSHASPRQAETDFDIASGVVKTGNGLADNEDDNESDNEESDFEIPPINIDPLTSEEDEDEEH